MFRLLAGRASHPDAEQQKLAGVVSLYFFDVDQIALA